MDEPSAPLPVPDFVRDDLRLLEIDVTDEALDRLARYLSLLLDANQRFNLTSIREPNAAWRRHIIDSLTVLPGLEELAGQGAAQQGGARVIDVGSGGGLPGMPIAIARPMLAVTLLEATGKKARFLQQCAESLGLANVTVLNARAEQAGRDAAHRQAYDAAICRAVGPLNELLEYTLPLVKVGGFVLAMKGPSVEQELGEAGEAMAILGGGEVAVYDAYPPGFEWDTVIVRIAKETATPAQYPRAPGIPRQQPLR